MFLNPSNAFVGTFPRGTTTRACLSGTESGSVHRTVELELPGLVDLHWDHVLRAKAPFEYRLGQRILDLALDRTFQRTRTIHRIEARRRDPQDDRRVWRA